MKGWLPVGPFLGVVDPLATRRSRLPRPARAVPGAQSPRSRAGARSAPATWPSRHAGRAAARRRRNAVRDPQCACLPQEAKRRSDMRLRSGFLHRQPRQTGVGRRDRSGSGRSCDGDLTIACSVLFNRTNPQPLRHPGQGHARQGARRVVSPWDGDGLPRCWATLFLDLLHATPPAALSPAASSCRHDNRLLDEVKRLRAAARHGHR